MACSLFAGSCSAILDRKYNLNVVTFDQARYTVSPKRVYRILSYQNRKCSYKKWKIWLIASRRSRRVTIIVRAIGKGKRLRFKFRSRSSRYSRRWVSVLGCILLTLQIIKVRVLIIVTKLRLWQNISSKIYSMSLVVYTCLSISSSPGITITNWYRPTCTIVHVM